MPTLVPAARPSRPFCTALLLAAVLAMVTWSLRSASAEPQPDVVITSLTLSPSTARAGDPVTATVTARNQGSGAAGPSVVGLHLGTSGGSSLTGAIPLGTLAIDGLSPGASQQASRSFTVPQVARGSFPIIAVADGASAIVETSEANNLRTATLQVTIPDLTVSRVTLTPSHARVGDMVTATAVVYNAGSVPASPSAVRLFFETGSNVPASMIASTTSALLAAGESRAVSLSFAVPSVPVRHSYYVWAQADPDSKLAETNEGNNRQGTWLDVTIPDLSITRLSLRPAPARVGDPVTAVALVRNNGPVPANASTLRVYFETGLGTPPSPPTLLGSATIPGLGPAESREVTFSFTVPNVPSRHSYYVWAQADPDSKLAETNEGNNRQGTWLDVTIPDLSITRLSLRPAPARVGDPVTAVALVRNNGPVPANASTLRVYFETGLGTPPSPPTLLGSATIPGLGPAESREVTFSFTVPNVPSRHSYYVWAQADPDSKLAETNEGNNRQGTWLDVTIPDLSITRLSLRPAPARVGDPVTAVALVRNNGPVPANASTLRVYFETGLGTPPSPPTLLGSATIPGLGPAESREVTFSFTVPNVPFGRSYNVWTQADPDSKLAETNEGNNRLSASLQVAVPDLSVDALSLTPTTARTADTITVSLRIRNRGAVPANASRASLYVTTNASAPLTGVAPLKSIDVPSLLPNTEAPLTLSVTLPALSSGRYQLIAMADSATAQTESTEANNRRATGFEVVAPVITIDALDVSPTLVQAGQTATASARVTNRGRVASRPTTATVFLATNEAAEITGGLSTRTIPISGLNPGASVTVPVPVAIPALDPGAYYVIAQVDASTAGGTPTMLASTAPAAASTNQPRRSVKLNVGLPDLTVTGLSVTRDEARAGDRLTVSFTATNAGPVAMGSSLVGLYLGARADVAVAQATSLTSVSVPGLSAGGSARLVGSIVVPAMAAGPYVLIAHADPGGAVRESLENNNRATAPMQIMAPVVPIELESALDESQLDMPWGYHSHYRQPWRAWLETIPGALVRSGVGIAFDWNIGRANEAVELRLLAEAGFSRIRVEVGWGHLAYDTDDLTPSDRAKLARILAAAKTYGIRPLILLNGHHGGPVPARALSRTVAVAAPAGARTLTLNDVTNLQTGFTGLSYLFDFKMAEILITAVNPSTRTVTLSKPLPGALAAGRVVTLHTLKYRPLSTPGSSDFEATLAGWLAYVRAIARAVTSAGITHFDLEIWNELTFGSDFLDINTYYNPALVPAADALHPGGRAWELARRTANLLAAEFPTATPIWGFSNTTFFHVDVPDLPPHILGQSYHPYFFTDYRSFANEQYGFVWNLEQFAPASPPYRAYFPEAAGNLIKTESLMRLLQPAKRHVRPSLSPTFQHVMTEFGFQPAEVGISDPDLARHLKAKALLRAALFWLNKGLDALWIYTDLEGSPTSFGLVPQDIAHLAQYPTDPSPYFTPALTALRHVQAAFEGAQPSPPLRTLQIDAAAADGAGGGLIFPGAGAHPALTYQDVFAALPFQLDARTFVLATYVMSRNFLTDLPPVPFVIRISGLNGTSAQVSALDPMEGLSVAVQVLDRTADSITVSMPVVDYPYLLQIRE